MGHLLGQWIELTSQLESKRANLLDGPQLISSIRTLLTLRSWHPAISEQLP
jgi:hypothetical protein